MKHEILAIKPIYEPAQRALEERYAVHKLWQAADAGRLVAEVAPRVRALVTVGTSGVPAALVAQLPHLGLIASSGAGTSMIDLDDARKRGIAVTNTPDADALADSVADLAFGMMLSLGRRIGESDRFVRAGEWTRGEFPLAHSFTGKRLGVIGMGSIGKALARRAEGFRLAVAYCGPRRKPELPFDYHPDARALAAQSDFLVAALPARPETRHAIDAGVLAALGAGGIFVNIARGGVVDTAALIDALQRRAILGAALDVFDDEPRVPAALIAQDNVLLTPHIGSSTFEIRSGRGEVVLANLAAFFGGGALQSRVA